MIEQDGLKITPERIEEYLQARQADGLSRNTLQSYRVKLNHINNALPENDKTVHRGTIRGIVDSFINAHA